jgi:hypothetical protein
MHGARRTKSGARRGLLAGAVVLIACLVAPAPAGAEPVARDAARDAGIFEKTTTWSANVADFDRDGRDDFLLVRHWQRTMRLYRNAGGGRFNDTLTPFPKLDRHDCAWADVNDDNRPDAFCTVGGEKGTGDGPKELWIQSPTGGFANKAVDYGVLDRWGRGRWSTFVDFNGDRFPDLFIGNEPGRADNHVSRNRFFVNVNGTHFVEKADAGVNGQNGSRCAKAEDVDQDGWEDLLVCTNFGFRLYRNEGGVRFTDVAAAAGVAGNWLDAEVADFDEDGRRDLALVNKLGAHVAYQNAEGTFDPLLKLTDLSGGRDLAVGDADGGYPDVYILQGSRFPDRYYTNDTGRSFHRVSTPQASSGIGDRVEAIDFDNDNRTDFIVLNGRENSTGPIQLITFT